MLWIAVPGGIKAGKALLRVLIVPKLDGGQLADHAMAQWPPKALQDGTVRVEVHKPGATVQASPDLTRDMKPTIPFQKGLWELLMDRITVEDARTLRAAPPGPLNVHPTSVDALAIAQTRRVASREKVTAAISPETEKYLKKVRAALLAAKWAESPQPASHSTKAAPPPSANPSPAGFHRTLSMLREHPSVLRALGLILELQLDNAAALAALTGGTVRVVWPDHSAQLPKVVSPRTQFGVDFFPGATPNLDSGMVTLDRLDDVGGRRWTVATVDVDVATQRLCEAAGAMRDRPEEPVTLPALRSGGLQLLLRGRGPEMRERLARALATQASMPDILTADDLVLGYRIDVLPTLGGTNWFSLHQRVATYHVHRRLADGTISEESTVIGSKEMAEEGHIKANAAIHDESGLHADEIVAAWKGWSLAVPRPSFEQATQATPPTKPGMNVSMELKAAPRSLPGLRFGQQYTLRARVADIAGGGRELSDSAPDHRTPVVFYGRYEPLLAPDVIVRGDTDLMEWGPGEAIENIVVRSDPTDGLNIAQYAARYHYRLDDQRLLRPPRTTQAVAEQHGTFDEAEPRQTWEWARLAVQGALPDPAAGGVAVAEPRRGAPYIPPSAWDPPWHNPTPKTLHLIDRPTGSPQAAWENGWLVVRLAPAEQITLQLSTFPKVELFGTFDASTAIPSDDASPSNPSEGTSADVARQGRHPVLSPTRTITFVHAVQRPLRAPDTVLTADRTRDQTFAELRPNSKLLDPKSTSQLDVSATWQDEHDHNTRDVRDEPVTTITIAPDSPEQPSTLFRHEFGDTRHRIVTYTLHAVSRFRHYFRESDTGPFTRTATLQPVIVKSSSRPPPPVVLSAKPAFTWEETGGLDTRDAVLTRKRLGNRIRLTLQPPWHCTGAGEQLAVIVRPQNNTSTELDNVVSHAGHDPIYPSRGLAGGPYPRDILSSTAGEKTLKIQEAGANAVIKPHTPTYIAEDDSWVCDVALPATFNYNFVQLAVARYQRHSLDDLWLSDVVKTDMVPLLLPERILRVTRRPNGFDVELQGALSDASAVNRVDMIVEQCQRPSGIPADEVDLIKFGTDDVPAWVGKPNEIYKPTPGLASGLLTRWKQTIPTTPGSGELRIRIREVELIPNSTARPGEQLQSGTAGEVKERTVFTDTVRLPPI